MNIYEAVEELTKAGVSESIRTLTIRKWIKEGIITSSENNGYSIDKQTTKLLQNSLRDEKNEIIKKLQTKIKLQDEYIEGIKAIHKDATSSFITQRENLNREISLLKKENNDLQKEVTQLLKENIRLRDDLIKYKENSMNKNKNSDHDQQEQPTSYDLSYHLREYQHKLGLAKIAGKKEIVASYKELLKLTHPDHGGDPKCFHYIKADFDTFKRNLKNNIKR
ncbi:hypothetical protein [Metabacillus sp. B2-18]|uniref:hypothetical protein n=1 Tax=Metabacillus sp. B2-18 TaxID=2897333 RepID=UPI001E3EAC1E|nr:hypothetical protein [Metabacillus sp. B2-18]UGB29157.1 hypothetical protein LPC09_15510 [Metabacillus sp. B2-18]